MKEPSEIRSWILKWLQRELNVPSAEIATGESLLNYGMDSVNAIMLVGDLEDQLSMKLKPTLLWDHQTVDALTDFLVSNSVKGDQTNSKIENTDAQVVEQQAISQEKAQQLLENIDELSDAEVSELLNRLVQE